MARNRLFDDDVIVIGLGRFGSAVALELTKLGHRVIAVEKNSALAESYVNKVAKVVHADMAQSTALDMIRSAEPKIAIVGIGSSVESSVLAAANLVDAEVPSIWAKALTPEAQAHPDPDRGAPRDLAGGRLRTPGRAPGQRQAARLHRVRRRLRDRQGQSRRPSRSASRSSRARSGANTE